MLTIPAGLRVYLCVEPTDMRKSFDTLAALVRDKLALDPLSGQLFVFRSRRGDRVKLLFWDGDGYVLFYKRLEAGCYRFPSAPADAASVVITANDFRLLLEGVDLASVRRGKRYVRPA